MPVDDFETFHGKYGMIGDSGQMKKLYEDIDVAAKSDETVFILGESGTGKELVARAIHENSSRREKRYTKFNCAAVPLELLESELFGHEKGAFTSAYARRKGKFEITDGGTFFLDEIADMHPSLQPKVLRVLEYKEFERVGGNEPIKVDVRLIAATSKNVRGLINENKFRPELFYRVNFLPLQIPPLRERRDDIKLLIYYFIEKYGGKGIENDALSRLVSYEWPGNVRELKSVIGRLVLRSDYGKISRRLVEEYGGLEGWPDSLHDIPKIYGMRNPESYSSDLEYKGEGITGIIPQLKAAKSHLQEIRKFEEEMEKCIPGIEGELADIMKLLKGGKQEQHEDVEKEAHERAAGPEDIDVWLSPHKISRLAGVNPNTLLAAIRRDRLRPESKRLFKYDAGGKALVDMDAAIKYFNHSGNVQAASNLKRHKEGYKLPAGGGPEHGTGEYLSVIKLSRMLEIPVTTIYNLSRTEFGKLPEKRSLKCSVDEHKLVTTLGDLSGYYRDGSHRSKYALEQIERYIRDHPGSEGLEIRIKRQPRN